ncbi:Major Facilitator Superfamily protein [Ferrithrix thermotolerans DSM 19514]|uniref:Major Facilitator Superfamily protein n=1 Tax=Ferrithrix thermotolerans DSM 19514 TaxID=1121881 RepID=A0A1M4YNG4_9ACTN|nr:MFS transporter [Ferrithrix thermotolerans]SHF07349.1 Major Facilitator Superfamily protein [Ferrithrix thermotolerans DSM 19514]
MDQSKTARSPEDRLGWRLVLLGTFISAIGSGLTLPFLIVYLHSIRHIALLAAGVVVATSGISGLITGAIGGSLGDRLGVGRILTLGLFLSGASTLTLSAVTTLLEAAVVVSVLGIGNSLTWPMLNSIIATQLSSENRPRAYAVRFGALNAGLGVGSVIAGLTVSLHDPRSFEFIYLADGCTTLVFASIVAFGLRGRPGFRSEPANSAQEQRKEGYAEVLRDHRFLAWLSSYALFVLFGYAMIDGGWAAYATVVVHATPQVVGFGFAANTLIIVTSQLGVAKVAVRYRRSHVLGGVGAVWVLCWLMSALADLPRLGRLPIEILLVASLAFFGLGETLLSPVSGSLPNDLAPSRLRARYNALGSTVWSIGTIVGPPIAGFLLGSSHPFSWIVVVTLGSLASGSMGLYLKRILPPELDRPGAYSP